MLGLSFLMALPVVSPAQGVKRLGVIDIEADTLTSEQRQEVLSELKSAFNDQRILSLVRDEEVESKLVQRNKQRVEVEALKREHQQKKSEIEKILEDGQLSYRSSDFDAAIRTLERAISLLSDASLELQSTTVIELFSYLGAAHYFAGNEIQARSYFGALLDLDAELSLNSQKFPPPVVDLFNLVKSDRRIEFKSWDFDSNVQDLKATFLGFEMKVRSGEKVSIELPREHPIWGRMAVVIQQEGFAPAIFAMNDLPVEVRLISTKDRRLVTRNLFSSLGTTTPPVELKKLVINLDLSVVFLGAVQKDFEGHWLFKGQLLEGATSRTSPVVQSSHAELSEAVKELVSGLMKFLDTEGRIIAKQIPVIRAPSEVASSTAPAAEEVDQSEPLYKSTWFWVGVLGVVGAGLGGYYVANTLLKPSDKLKATAVQGN